MSLRIKQAVHLLGSIATGDAAASSVINPDQYIQHNLTAPDDRAGYLGLQKLVSGDPNAKIRSARAFEDGDYVFLHSEYAVFGQNTVGFDIFRFEGDQIVEHWDNLQALSGPNQSGHTMIDGLVEADADSPAAPNKALVRSFLEEVLVRGETDGLARFFDGDRYIQHNPAVSDGVSGLSAAAAVLAKNGKSPKYAKVHILLGEGDFVLAASEGTVADAPTAFFDLFRIEGGKLAEHWDTVAAIPARESWKNANGKF